jgi:hypothetical protein
VAGVKPHEHAILLTISHQPIFYEKTYSPHMKNRKNDWIYASLQGDHRGEVHFVPV